MSRVISTVLELARLKMAIFSAVTYSCAYTLTLITLKNEEISWNLDLKRWFLGYFFMFLCQVTAHLLGEYYDFESDKLNVWSSKLTGGSKVLVKRQQDGHLALKSGWLTSVLALTLLFTSFDESLRPLGLGMLFFAHQYSAPPFLLNHLGLGELTASVIMNICVPIWAASVHFDKLDMNLLTNIWQRGDWRLLLAPAYFNKVALLLTLNIADRLPDWRAGKNTLAVKLGDEGAGKFHGFLMLLAMASTGLALYAPIPSSIPLVLAVLFSLYPALGISKVLASKDRPHKITPLIGQMMAQTTQPILALTFYGILLQVGFDWNTVALFIRLVPLILFFHGLWTRPSPPPPPALQDPIDPVVIIGAGPAGLVLAKTLQSLGIESIVLEKREKDHAMDGADLGLWPSSLTILERLFNFNISKLTWPVGKVWMKKMDGTVLREVDMTKVTGKDRFSLCSRKVLMDSLEGNVIYNVQVTKTTQEMVTYLYNGKKVNVKPWCVVGADGINSMVRKFLDPTPIRFAGEVCHRGVIQPGLVEEYVKNQPRGMELYYGEGTRASFGYVDEDKRVFWWYKHPADNSEIVKEKNPKWPSPFPELLKYTKDDEYWVEPVLDKVASKKHWSDGIIGMVGDACHPMTPNMGQGATTAIEDGFYLGVLLWKYRQYPDGVFEAFYHFEMGRRRYVEAIASSSFAQAKLGQLRGRLSFVRDAVLRYAPLEKMLKKTNTWLGFQDVLKEWEMGVKGK